MTAALSYARFELVRSLRDTRFTFFLIAMPGLLYVLYSGFATNAGESGLSGPAARMVALACYAAMGGALYSIGPPLAAERASGWIRQLRITPLPGPSWLSAKMLHAAAMTVPGVIVVGVLGVALEDVHASGTHWAIATAILVAGSLPFALIGLVIGQALEGQASNSATLLFLILTSFLGGIFIPSSTLPQLARQLGQVFPSTHLGALARHALAGTAVPLSDIAVLAAWALGAAVVALVLRRRDGAAG